MTTDDKTFIFLNTGLLCFGISWAVHYIKGDSVTVDVVGIFLTGGLTLREIFRS